MAYSPKLPKDIRCPLEYGLDVFGGKWKSRIICVLGPHETLRYSDLKRQLVNISHTALAIALKELLDDGLIVRRQYETIPPQVEYALSEKGRSVIPILQMICRWSGQFFREISAKSSEQCRSCDYGSGGMQ